MPSNALEDGEIDSEHEALQDLNNEGIIDEIIQKENSSAKKSENQPRTRQRGRKARGKRQSSSRERRDENPRESTSASSWRSNNNVGNTDRMRRPPPSDAIMFPAMQNNSIGAAHSAPFYPNVQPPSHPNFNFFNPPPPLLQFAGPPPPPMPPPSRPQQIPGTYRGANFDNVRMEISDTPEEPSSIPREAFKPPVQIPLTSMLPPPPPPPVLHDEPDADALRQMLLSQMTLKRGAEPVKSVSKRKKSRSISKTEEPTPAPPKPVVQDSPASPDPVPVQESQLDKQQKLGIEIQKLDSYIKESQGSIRSEHEELKKLTERCKFLKESMEERRVAIKEAAGKKRVLQTQLEALDEEELDILCDDIIFEKIFRPAAPAAVQVPTKMESVKDAVLKAKGEPAPSPVQASAPPLVAPTQVREPQEEIKRDELQEISESEDSDEEMVRIEDEENLENEEERDPEEEIEVVVPANSISNSIVIGLNAELSLREKLLAKCGKSRQSPDVAVTSSSPDRADSCRNFLLKLCKFELNGTCTRGRECTFLHLVDVTDETQQKQLLEGLFRDVLAYREIDIEAAIYDVLAFLPRFEQFEKLVHYFLSVVMQRNPEFRSRLFDFFANGR